MMLLSSIVEQLTADGIVLEFSPGETDLFDRAEIDSREIGPHNCFVAIRGHEVDGHMFIDKAVKNGAVAIVYEVTPEILREGLSGVALVHVTNSRQALLRLAAIQNQNPADDMVLVGTTGTNGKTTVATLIRHVLEYDGRPCGFIGTTEYAYGSTSYPARETTPSALRVYGLLAEMKSAGFQSCSMEVSSHALDQWRVNVSDFNVAVFTNLTRDHLDYHETESAYLDAKKRLFDGLLAGSSAVVNMDDPVALQLIEGISAQALTFGTVPEADVKYEIVQDHIEGLQLQIDGKKLMSRLAGRFNAGNLAAAYACSLSLEVPPEKIVQALEKAPPVPGRFELFRGRRGKSIVVDYAHTPDALENVLNAAKRIRPTDSTLWCVFGCGGDRDTGKRSTMGRIAENLADRVIVTSDNPRTEDPQAILNDVAKGFVHPEKARFIVDRRDAIDYVASESGPADLIVVAGKGHETVQVIGTTSIPLDDREEIKRAFEVELNHLELN
ncbi:MAG: UDP-N-acetylmuramoyl-L-alanyl-D-glutamate--2,6-diaminopimelate ligase [Rhodothermia bacterium]|nr:MAG: UDP-N-acetylmuramoyl-L-alanyl-D-glutamate--2,6-diaminopimelate ligase [Rhodothermia bacterium]